MGIVFIRDGQPWVFEAVEPVRWTELEEFLARGDGMEFALLRLRNAAQVLTPANQIKLVAEAQKYLGKPYDRAFDWSDDQFYCSEIVWKVYRRALGVELCPLRHMKDYDLSSDPVQKQLHERYGDHIPLGETVVAPSDILRSTSLKRIH